MSTKVEMIDTFYGHVAKMKFLRHDRNQFAPYFWVTTKWFKLFFSWVARFFWFWAGSCCCVQLGKLKRPYWKCAPMVPMLWHWGKGRDISLAHKLCSSPSAGWVLGLYWRLRFLSTRLNLRPTLGHCPTMKRHQKFLGSGVHFLKQ